MSMAGTSANAQRATILTTVFEGSRDGNQEDVVMDAVFNLNPKTIDGKNEQPLPAEDMKAAIPVPVGNDIQMTVVVMVYKGWLDFDSIDYGGEMAQRSGRFVGYSVDYVDKENLSEGFRQPRGREGRSRR